MITGCIIQYCPPNRRLDHDLCLCLLIHGWLPVPTECQPPEQGCQNDFIWDGDLCKCSSVNSLQDANKETVCEGPIGGCQPGYYWDNSACVCDIEVADEGSGSDDGDTEGNFLVDGMDEFCTRPPEPCLADEYWDRDLCECRPLGNVGPPLVRRCVPPSHGCQYGHEWNMQLCRCDVIRPTKATPATDAEEPSSCSAPAGGCSIGMQWDENECSCVPPGSRTLVCIGPASGCPVGLHWDLNQCRCRGGDPCEPVPCPTARRMYFDPEFCHCRPFTYFRK